MLRVGEVGGDVWGGTGVGEGGGKREGEGEGADGGWVVRQGDYLIADLNGVVCVPRGLAGEVVGLVGGLVERDELIRRDLEGGGEFGESCRVRRG